MTATPAPAAPPAGGGVAQAASNKEIVVKLTPAARKMLLEAAANGNWVHRPTYGPMTQLVEAGYAKTYTSIGGNTALELTWQGQYAARRILARRAARKES